MYVVTLRRLMQRAQQRGVRVLLTGYAGDLVLTGSYYYLFELMMARRWPALRHELHCYPMGLRCRLLLELCGQALRLAASRATRGYRIPTWIARNFAARVDLPPAPGRSALNGPDRPCHVRPKQTRSASPNTRPACIWQQKEALRHGMELRHPLPRSTALRVPAGRAGDGEDSAWAIQGAAAARRS